MDLTPLAVKIMKGRLEKDASTPLLGVKIEGVSTRCNDLWRVTDGLKQLSLELVFILTIVKTTSVRRANVIGAR